MNKKWKISKRFCIVCNNEVSNTAMYWEGMCIPCVLLSYKQLQAENERLKSQLNTICDHIGKSGDEFDKKKGQENDNIMRKT